MANIDKKQADLFEAWVKAGDKVKCIRNEFEELTVLLSQILPKTKYGDRLRSAKNVFEKLRSYLDDLFAEKFPEKSDRELNNAFYGSESETIRVSLEVIGKNILTLRDGLKKTFKDDDFLAQLNLTSESFADLNDTIKALFCKADEKVISLKDFKK